jgi:hypothetical protein
LLLLLLLPLCGAGWVGDGGWARRGVDSREEVIVGVEVVVVVWWLLW